MKNILILLAVALFIVSCGSPANKNKMARAEVSHNSKVVLADKNSDEKVVCKQIMKTGSHRKTTVCQSASEIARIRNETQNDMSKVIHKTGTTSGESGGL